MKLISDLRIYYYKVYTGSWLRNSLLVEENLFISMSFLGLGLENLYKGYIAIL